MATGAVLNPPGFSPTFEPVEPIQSTKNKTVESVEMENIQTRIAKIYAKILTILSDVSIGDQERTASLKKQIKKLSGEIADATSSQGRNAAIVACATAVFSVGSCFAPNPHAQQVSLSIVNSISSAISEVLKSRTDSKNTLTASERDLLTKDLERIINKSASEQGFKQGTENLFGEALQVIKTATRL